MNFKRGTYVPKHKDKYMGKQNPIFRSSWELKFMEYCDKNPNVVQWASEPFPIRYYLPTDGKWRKYFPDFLMTTQTKDGNFKKTLVEIKPANQTRPPKKGNKKKATILREHKTWIMNQSKWEAAQNYCNRQGISFKIFTEKELGIK